MSTIAKRVSERMRAGALVMVVQDPDEALALGQVRAAHAKDAEIRVMSAADPDVMNVLDAHRAGRGTLVLLDFLACSGSNEIATRMVRQVALQERAEGDKHSKLILIEQTHTRIPQGLVGDAEIITATLPDIAELREELDAFVANVPSLQSDPAEHLESDETKYRLASSVAGLARHEAARLFARCYVETKGLDARWLRSEKAKRVASRLNGALTFEPSTGSDVGGLDALRGWLGSRRAAFGSSAAKAWGLPEPKGLLLVGTPGSGKSLTARTVAREWGLPLLRLDAGRLFGSLVGQSEGQTRQAIDAAEACAPCVLWIDEIEKGLAGSTGGNDSGTSARVFGALLTWLQEKTSPVFVVATANRIAALPPELLRKGRFDEIFYVGLPSRTEREAIFRIHLERRKRTLLPSAIAGLAQETEGFSGAEIEQAIVEGLFQAYADNARDLRVDDIKGAIAATTPLSKTMEAEIQAIEKWAVGRARYASTQRPAATNVLVPSRGRSAFRPETAE